MAHAAPVPGSARPQDPQEGHRAGHDPAQGDILHFYLPAFAGGGAERIFIRIANHLAAQGRPVRFVVNHDGGPLRPMLSQAVDLQVLGVRRAPQAVMALARYLRRNRPEVLISALTRTNIVALLSAGLAGSGTRVIVCERNQYSTFVSGFGPARRWTMNRLVRWLYPRAHAVIGNTAGVTDDITAAAGLSTERTGVIHNPAPDLSEMLSAHDDAPDHPWFSDGKPVAVAIGRLVAQKDYPTMLSALAQSGDSLRLAILGDGPERDALQDLAQQLGIADRVAFLGYRLNRFAYLVRADLFLLSSRTEGFPNALIEAVTAGVPAIATDCAGGGAREIMGREFPGRIVPVGDAAAMAAAIKRCLAAPGQGMADTDERDRAARIAGRYQIEAIAEAFLARAAA